ncbi:hypothetical protein P691DRAFT_170637 [Macrolepiota fuliginosa MF-IS2]|uniref:Uncharacterized protein n=1 Tax=Macrolepiota fuliginosa MF-IS2 TaxID=1400762 RepID=A0A9P6BZU5_9AGAR|nr:hypothetical protein P691DRAFT_170637 [Macrolepiota fuliginosa MF-IS2]
MLVGMSEAGGSSVTRAPRPHHRICNRVQLQVPPKSFLARIALPRLSASPITRQKSHPRPYFAGDNNCTSQFCSNSGSSPIHRRDFTHAFHSFNPSHSSTNRFGQLGEYGESDHPTAVTYSDSPGFEPHTFPNRKYPSYLTGVWLFGLGNRYGY